MKSAVELQDKEQRKQVLAATGRGVREKTYQHDCEHDDVLFTDDDTPERALSLSLTRRFP